MLERISMSKRRKEAAELLLDFERLETRGQSVIPYSDAALKHDLKRIRDVWDDVQGKRDRRAIHVYLEAIWKLAALWDAVSKPLRNCERALQLSDLNLPLSESSFSVIIACTSDPEKVDRRTRHKWARLLQYANDEKPISEELGSFIQRKGGINRCAQRSRSLEKNNEDRRNHERAVRNTAFCDE